MKKNSIKFLLLLFFLNSCAGMPKYTSIPVNPNDVCDIFNQKTHWYYHTKKSEEKWGTPVYVQMAIIHGESGFNFIARPGRKTLINNNKPYKRLSSAFGYAQVLDGTWKMYKKETEKKIAIRTSFKDSVDFIGWYTAKSNSILKISQKDVYNQYLAYHQGWGGYKKGVKKQAIKDYAQRVSKQAAKYKGQLNGCRSNLEEKVKKIKTKDEKKT